MACWRRGRGGNLTGENKHGIGDNSKEPRYMESELGDEGCHMLVQSQTEENLRTCHQLHASWFGTWKNFKMGGMTVFDLYVQRL